MHDMLAEVKILSHCAVPALLGTTLEHSRENDVVVWRLEMDTHMVAY